MGTTIESVAQPTQRPEVVCISCSLLGNVDLSSCNTDETMLENTGVLISSLARPGRKQATATEDFDSHISYLQS